MIWRFPAAILRVIDGDTFEAMVDRGFRDASRKTFRLLGSELGVDAFEMRAADPELRALAILGKARFVELAPAGATVEIVSEKGAAQILPDSFGRWLAQCVNADGVNIGDTLLAEGLAKPYVKGW